MYRLEYLPVALQDMAEITHYISHELQNPSSAERLSAKFVEAADGISAFPYANPTYQPIRPLQREYRKLLAENYLMLYWVDEPSQTVTIARVIYSRRDYEKKLEK